MIMSEPIRIVLVDSQLAIMESVAFRLEHETDMRVVGMATTADDALTTILEHRPQFTIMESELFSKSPMDILPAARERVAGLRSLFFSAFYSDILIEQALKLNTRGYITKNDPNGFNSLIWGIRRVHSGGVYFSKAIDDRIEYDRGTGQYKLKKEGNLSCLSERQLSVLRLLAKGRTVKEVASLLGVTEKSIDSHKYRLMHKLGIRDRVELSRFATREGLVLP
ncbi:MAG: DNA-binding response regulator [Planctomycetaceae bacterium]|nr:DNA-binding response regulator [Planctomycetaceae bacterium]